MIQNSTPALKVNVHTHTSFCDGKNTAEEMVLSALEAGFDVLGFSGHSYTSFDESYCMSRENVSAYCSEVRRLAETYRGRLAILCGIEQDLFADDPVSGFDYAIGSVHAVFKECSPNELASIREEGFPSGVILSEAAHEKCGVYYYVDWERETMEWAIRRLYGGDSLALAEDYFQAVSQFACDPACSIVGHFDLLTKFDEPSEVLSSEASHEKKDSKAAALFDISHPRYQDAACKAIHALSASGKIFEINTGAMAKGYRTTPYPDALLLKQILRAGGRITVNSDCHAAGMLDYGFEEAFALARATGFREIWSLNPEGKWIPQPL